LRQEGKETRDQSERAMPQRKHLGVPKRNRSGSLERQTRRNKEIQEKEEKKRLFYRNQREKVC